MSFPKLRPRLRSRARSRIGGKVDPYGGKYKRKTAWIPVISFVGDWRRQLILTSSKIFKDISTSNRTFEKSKNYNNDVMLNLFPSPNVLTFFLFFSI